MLTRGVATLPLPPPWQIMKLYMLEGAQSRSLDAVRPLLGRGDVFYQSNLWETISIASIVCNRNCTQRPAPPANQRDGPNTGQGTCDGLTGLCNCAIGYSGDDCSVPNTTEDLHGMFCAGADELVHYC